MGGPIPSRPVHSPENGILVGPGGPVDYPSPARPPIYHQKPIGGFGNNGNGVLVGPGGPTGVVGRPQYLGGNWNKPHDFIYFPHKELLEN